MADAVPAPPTVVALSTLQFASGGLCDATPVDGMVHLVRVDERLGTPGPTLCGIDRFAKTTPGWSVGGGVVGSGITHTPCPGCVDAAARQAPGLPVIGCVGAKDVARVLLVPAYPTYSAYLRSVRRG